MKMIGKIDARGRSGFAASPLARLFAVLLVFAFLLPTVLQATTSAASHPFAHAVDVVGPGEVGSKHAQSGCCIECPQHSWYRHAEAQAPSTAVRRAARGVSYVLSNETASSSDVAPPTEPPKA